MTINGLKCTYICKTDNYFLLRTSTLELFSSGDIPNMSSSSHSSCCSPTQRRRRLRDWEEHPILVWRRYEDECANDLPQVSHLSLTKEHGVSSMLLEENCRVLEILSVILLCFHFGSIIWCLAVICIYVIRSHYSIGPCSIENQSDGEN